MMIPPRTGLRAEKIGVGYGPRLVLGDLSIAFPTGRVTAIVGPNGCGKTTLLGALARLLKPTSGAVLLDGRALAQLPPREAARSIGLLPQNATAPEGLTVTDLVRFGRHPHQGLLRQWSPEDQRITLAAMAAADVTGLADRRLETLSGGQRQRAWLAMAIAQETPFLLLDEPTAFLDLGHQIEIFELVRRLAEGGKTCVLVLHDLSSACRWADNLVAMRDGRILAEGPPRDVVTPELIRALYDIDCQLLTDPLSGTPLLAGLSLVKS